MDSYRSRIFLFLRRVTPAWLLVLVTVLLLAFAIRAITSVSCLSPRL